MSQNEHEGKTRVGITCGDFNGIGLEVVMKTFLDNRMHQVCTPVIYAGSKMVSQQRKLLNMGDFNYTTIRPGHEVILRKNNVMYCWDDELPVEWGQSTELSGRFALHSLEAAVADLAAGKIDTLVTAPINKHNIPSKDGSFRGHTEYLAEKFRVNEFLMFLISENLKVAVVSGHVPVKNIASGISRDAVLKKLKLMHASLARDFGIRKPKIAVLGLNPHAGDDGLLGSEEKDIIAPLIRDAFSDGLFVYGPYSADGFFGSGAFRQFDAVLAMYHDQGLVPFKTMSFNSGVNFTAGLPVVRTSPDHGTAYDIAGKGVAREDSIREAIYRSVDILKMRQEYDEINARPLAYSKKGGDQ